MVKGISKKSSAQARLSSETSAASSSSAASFSGVTANPQHAQSQPTQSTTFNVNRPSTNNNKKILAALQKIPLNRSCADCGSPFVDPSSVWVSISPILSDENKEASRSDTYSKTPQPLQQQREPVSVSLHDFGLTHEAFAPPVHVQAKHRQYQNRPRPSSSSSSLSSNNDDDDNTKDGESTTSSMMTSTLSTNDVVSDRNKKLRLLLGGHGVFICLECSEAHILLGTLICHVKVASQLTHGEATWIERNGGNERCNVVYERYMNEMWKQRKPVPLSEHDVRRIFVRAKYEALAFVLPPPGPIAPAAWGSILHRNKSSPWSSSPDLRDIMSFSPGAQLRDDEKGRRTSGLKDQLPNRLVDHLCVVSPSMKLQPVAGRQASDLYNREAVERVALFPQISDCFPERNSHPDMEFPEHLPNFVMPLGCHPSLDPEPPTFHFQILTTSESEHLFCGCLLVYDDSIEVKTLKKDMMRSLPINHPKKGLPEFLRRTDDGDHAGDHDDDNDCIVFLPKCLVVISHHPFFDLWRHVLLGLYHRSLAGSSLPLERLIANFCCEIPLPPHGRVKVEWRGLTIERPAPNQLPMANISFRPLFASLSVGNILVVVSCLLHECKVVVHSTSLSILCPVTEALRSALFPFLWQGIYIPILPLSLGELLDAPVPFFVGVHSDYMRLVDASQQPNDVVFVDLDRDIVKLGELDIPIIPSKPASKLQNALEAAGGSAAYLVPNSGIKGCVMAGPSNSAVLPNENRPPYAQMTTMTGLSASSLGRNEVFATTDLAYGSGRMSMFLLAFIGQGHGHISDDDNGHENLLGQSKQPKSLIMMKSPVKKFTSKAGKTRKILASSDAAMSKLVSGETHLLDINDNDNFSTDAIRSAFLRFTVSLFSEYEDFIFSGGDDDMFDVDGFVRECHQGSPFIRKICETQMFQTFLREKQERHTYEIQFFDEHIRAKKNRSKRETLKNGGKQETPFLSDQKTWKITQTYCPPDPNKLGLPDTGKKYVYGSFPKLDPELFGKVRSPVTWPQIRDRSSTQLVKRRRADMMKNAIKGFGSAPTAIMSVAGRTAKDIDSLMFGMSSRKEKKESSTQSLTTNGRPTGQKAKPLSKMDTIVLNSRRKQMLLLDTIVLFQACSRGYLTRTRLAFLNNAERLELKERSQGETCKAKSIQRRTAAVKIQAVHRRNAARTHLYCIRKKAVTIQARLRSRRARMLFMEIRSMTINVQAAIRGWLLRKCMKGLIASMMERYKRQVSMLWIHTHAPLSLRTKLWRDLTKEQQTFLRLNLAKRELNRLWNTSALDRHPVSMMTDDIVKSCDRLGVNSETYRLCVLFESNNEAFKMNYETIGMDTLRVEETERLQIYERLSKDESDDDISIICKRFDISIREKLKKMSVAQKMFTNENDVDASVRTMMELFPELEKSLGMIYKAPSGKGTRRFRNAYKNSVPPVDSTLWDYISLEHTIKRHVNEVALLFITKVPAIQRRLDRSMDTDPLHDPTKSFREALVKSHNAASWKDLKYCLLRSYLECR